MDETPSSPEWDFQACLLFKKFILENQDRLPFNHMKNVYNQDKKTSVYQFQVGYMTHTMMKNIEHT